MLASRTLTISHKVWYHHKHSPVLQAPCQHNFCLGCFSRWAAKGKSNCPTCRAPFPAKLAANPRINTALASAIRMVKQGIRPLLNKAEIERVTNDKRPDVSAHVEDLGHSAKHTRFLTFWRSHTGVQHVCVHPPNFLKLHLDRTCQLWFRTNLWRELRFRIKNTGTTTCDNVMVQSDVPSNHAAP